MSAAQAWIDEQRNLIQKDHTLTDGECAELVELVDMVSPHEVETFSTIKLVAKNGDAKLLKTGSTNVAPGTLIKKKAEAPPRPNTPSQGINWMPTWLLLGTIALIATGVFYRKYL